jgi:hypothetical protein
MMGTHEDSKLVSNSHCPTGWQPNNSPFCTMDTCVHICMHIYVLLRLLYDGMINGHEFFIIFINDRSLLDQLSSRTRFVKVFL